MKSLIFILYLILLPASLAQAESPKHETIYWYVNNFTPYVILTGPDKGKGVMDQAMQVVFKRLPEYKIGIHSTRSFGAIVDTALKKKQHSVVVLPYNVVDGFSSRFLKLTMQNEFEAIVGYSAELGQIVRSLWIMRPQPVMIACSSNGDPANESQRHHSPGFRAWSTRGGKLLIRQFRGESAS